MDLVENRITIFYAVCKQCLKTYEACGKSGEYPDPEPNSTEKGFIFPGSLPIPLKPKISRAELRVRKNEIRKKSGEERRILKSKYQEFDKDRIYKLFIAALESGQEIETQEEDGYISFRLEHITCVNCDVKGNIVLGFSDGDPCPKCKIGEMKSYM